MKAFALTLLALAAARPASAQVELRPYALFAEQRFAASKTFDAVFESDVAPFWGGGVDVVVHRRFFVDVAVSHMSRSGQRAFVNDGDVFRLGIPLSVTSTPVEVTAGYRLRLKYSRLTPYAGAGIGSYSYHETSGFSTTADDVDVRHAGFVAVGGAEYRVGRHVLVSGDAHYTRVPGILGQAGLSKDVNEHDFGGLAARLRIMISR